MIMGFPGKPNQTLQIMLFKKQETNVSIVDGSESSFGYRSVRHSLQLAGICVPRSLVQRILKDIDPEGTDSRRRHRLRRRIYRNPGPNYA